MFVNIFKSNLPSFRLVNIIRRFLPARSTIKNNAVMDVLLPRAFRHLTYISGDVRGFVIQELDLVQFSLVKQPVQLTALNDNYILHLSYK